MTDLEDALKKLDWLTQEEARMAHVEVMRIAHNIRDQVKIVDGKVEGVDDKVDGVGNKVEDVGDQVQCVDDKVQVVIDGARGLSSRLSDPSNTGVYLCRRQAGKFGNSTGGQRHRRN